MMLKNGPLPANQIIPSEKCSLAPLLWVFGAAKKKTVQEDQNYHAPMAGQQQLCTRVPDKQFRSMQIKQTFRAAELKWV